MARRSSRYISAFPRSGPGDRRSFEKVLADTLRPFIRELLLVDAGTLIGYALAEDSSNLEDIIASCGECVATQALLRYGGCAVATCEWGKAPAVSIELELHHAALTTFFRIVLAAESVEIELHGLVFPGPAPDAAEAWSRYRAAFAQTSQAASELATPTGQAAALATVRRIM